MATTTYAAVELVCSGLVAIRKAAPGKQLHCFLARGICVKLLEITP